MQRLALATLILTTMMLTGCASLGPSDYTDYANAYKDHSEAKANIAKACLPELSVTASDAEKAYARSAAILCVAMVSQGKFELVKPTTGWDVAGKLVDQVPFVAATGFMWQLGKTGIENAGSKFGDGAVLTDSMNRTSSTSVARGNATSSTSGTMPAADPVIVEPMVVEVPK